MEKRTYEFRAADAADNPRRLLGHAAVFNQEAVIAGLFREVIRPGAFAKTIKEADIRALWNHDPNIVLGRVKAGTLSLSEDEIGLLSSIEPPDTPMHNSHLESVRRGDVDQMSFMFDVIKESWLRSEGDGLDLREIQEVRLYEVSPVTFPAYEGTDIAVEEARSIFSKHQATTPEPRADAHSEEPELWRLDICKRQLELLEAQQ